MAPGTTEIGIYTKTARLPGAPTGVSATPENKEAQVSFTQAATNGSPITTYTVTSSPDASHLNGVTAKGTKSPITVKGLTQRDALHIHDNCNKQDRDRSSFESCQQFSDARHKAGTRRQLES